MSKFPKGIYVKVYSSKYDVKTNKLMFSPLLIGEYINSNGDIEKIPEIVMGSPTDVVLKICSKVSEISNEVKYHIEPVNKTTTESFMIPVFNDKFIWSDDPKFPFKHPIPLHDKFVFSIKA